MTECIKSTTGWAANDKGYPMYMDATGKAVNESRIVYCKHNNTPLEAIKGLVIMHTCDNPSCVNPQHLKLGTQSDNMQDMWDKGRHPGATNQPVGEQHYKAILTWELVAAIRAAPKGYGMGKFLAKKYNVSTSTISLILKNKIWREQKAASMRSLNDND